MRHSRQAQSGTYSNMFVRGHKYGPGWGPILSAVARLGFILRFLVLGDLLEFLALFKSLGPVPGAVVPPHHLVWLFLGHLIKWPPCVARWAAVLAAERPADPAGRPSLPSSSGPTGMGGRSCSAAWTQARRTAGRPDWRMRVFCRVCVCVCACVCVCVFRLGFLGVTVFVFPGCACVFSPLAPEVGLLPCLGSPSMLSPTASAPRAPASGREARRQGLLNGQLAHWSD